MILLPAIDLRAGKCVRLLQGDYAKETIYGDDPVVMAKRWESEGGDWLHLVDLDGAKAGRPVNTAVIADIVRNVKIPCELGGGIRSKEGIQAALELGVKRVILGTQALREPAWFRQMAFEFPGKLVLGVDAKGGQVATEGWLDVSSISAEELVAAYNDLPLSAIVYTDIAKDGMLAGPNAEATQAIARISKHLVIASGGVTTIDDVLELRSRQIGACILGRTLYEGNMKLPELVSRLKSGSDSSLSEG